MKIFYQWIPWAYSHKVWIDIWKHYWIKDIIWQFSFKDMFASVVKENWIWIVPIENSYAGSVHENFYNISSYDVKIIWEYYLPVRHCLLSTSEDKKTLKKAYSHYQALMQCENYLKKNNIEPVIFQDTASSAKYVKEQNDESVASIASSLAAEIYNLNILDKDINDDFDNTTRFLIVIPKDVKIENYSHNNKMSILFKVKDMPAVLYKCLGAFATRDVNLSKIESLPSKEWNFEYMFWIDFEYSNKNVEWVIDELKFYAKDIRILWKY